MAARRALAASVVAALAGAAPAPQRCADGACPAAAAPVLLQTHAAQASRAAAPERVPPLVAPYVPPPRSARAAAPKRRVALHPSQEGAHAFKASPATSHSAREWELVRQLTELRRDGFTCPGGRHFQPNFGELTFDCRLFRAARAHSEDMGRSGYFSHISPEGRDPFDRSHDEDFGTYYEIIAAGRSDAKRTLEQWKAQQEHCESMMTPSHNRVGVGHAKVETSPYQNYWTMLLASDSGPEDTTCYLIGAGAPPPHRGCIDSNVDCEAWVAEGYCQGNYRNFMRQSCPVSCDMCGPQPEPEPVDPAPLPVEPGAPTDADCVDTDDNCAYWVSMGYCGAGHDFQDFMAKTCALSCGCGSGVIGGDDDPPLDPNCKDEDISCRFWSGLGHCAAGADEEDSILEKCRRSCRVCQ